MPLFSSLSSWISNSSSSRHDRILTMDTALKAVAGITACAGTYYILRQLTSSSSSRKKYAGLKKIPEPKGAYPYLGHLLSIGDDVGAKFTEWQEQVGPVMQVRLGVVKWIVVSDPVFAYDLFCIKGAVASSRPVNAFVYEYYAMGGKGLVFAPTGKSWRNTRKAVVSVLAPPMVDKFMPILEKEADYLIERLAADPNGIDPRQALQVMTMNAVLLTCFGVRATSVDDPLFQEIANYVDESLAVGGLQGDVTEFLPILKFFDKFGQRTKKRKVQLALLEKRNAIFERLIKQALDSKKDCFVRHFYNILEEHELDDRDVVVTMSDMIIAGTDTTSVSLVWLFAILAHHPEVQKRIQAEIDIFVQEHGRLPSFAERRELPYLISVQKEGMRFRSPSVFGMSHVVEEDVECQGYLIPKGTPVFPNMLGMHHNPNVFSEPEKFIPERFIENTSTMTTSANGRLENRDHFNFGWGRRVCPGIYLSEAEMFLAMVRLLAKYTIEPSLDAAGKPVYPDIHSRVSGGLIVLPQSYKVRFIPRTDAAL
ncbi:cytochrome p450 [Lichtheimia corymbifera JMRC:FSU:9682]|uniref:Cytochrome p450 n=1 Tax=Lichtheimia corymbifera JMRC:FSU:9682 TaxID=1263082 RepID=A0A068RM70_9FUNG|nr:cytochrome p450 [Lichtheimia corymbifera JMRC:FSU:9682]